MNAPYGEDPQSIHEEEPMSDLDLGKDRRKARRENFVKAVLDRPTDGVRLIEKPEPENAAPQSLWDGVVQWWQDQSTHDVTSMTAKVQEYGGAHRASDLIDLGRTMAELQGEDPGVMSDAHLQELGIFFYLEGKLGRWKAALKEGRRVSDDTLLDITVYAMMTRRVRAAGGWPV